MILLYEDIVKAIKNVLLGYNYPIGNFKSGKEDFQKAGRKGLKPELNVMPTINGEDVFNYCIRHTHNRQNSKYDGIFNDGTFNRYSNIDNYKNIAENILNEPHLRKLIRESIDKELIHRFMKMAQSEPIEFVLGMLSSYNINQKITKEMALREVNFFVQQAPKYMYEFDSLCANCGIPQDTRDLGAYWGSIIEEIS